MFAFGIETLATTSRQERHAHIPTRLDKLAPELLLRIFALLRLGEATCLGLTCRRLYSILKDRYPEPINLRTRFPSKALACRRCSRRRSAERMNCCWSDLYHFLASWTRPRYRLGHANTYSPRLLFFDRNIYGENDDLIPDIRERRVIDRYKSHQSIKFHLQVHGHRHPRSSEAMIPSVPDPFNQGDKWYADAITFIKEDISHFESEMQWKKFWAPCNDSLIHFNEKEDEYRWKLWSEGWR
ncbi:hypothetical protein L207DRAFT_74733 [Hyaloscypha variabilis F]|uniref:F-box domain-containing protein n=1 Tax=Hyaloscypha variabilis (strain UAMH 11265 / GT02V1 / F) TaxID=1149755 RepID=A0A2J6RFQ9_HYAVF|nr:hypothetical protein L207DRAFT_74733 [Hyaloscypha variabilis F]